LNAVKTLCWIGFVLSTLVVTNPAWAADPETALPGKLSDSRTEVPFKLYGGYVILVEGSIGSLEKLRFIIDTGATTTFIDRKLGSKLGLLSTSGSISHFNKVTRAHWVAIPELQVGPLRAVGLSVPMVDLSYVADLANHVDAIIGLDVLRTSSFTIDYRSKRISFGAISSRGFSVPILSTSPYLVVQIQVRGYPVRLVVDSSANCLVLYEDRIDSRVAGIRVVGEMLVRSVGGSIRAKKMWLPATLGGTNLDGDGLLLGSSTDARLPVADGYMGLTTLRAWLVAFDFQRNTLSWQK
jgi:Aspartyl protease